MPVHVVSLLEAEENLTELARLAVSGVDVQIELGDGLVMKLVMENALQGSPVGGLHRGNVHMSDDFDEMIDELQYSAELYCEISEGLKDSKAGRTKPAEEVRKSFLDEK